MKKSTLIIVVAIIAILAIGGVVLASRKKDTNTTATSTDSMASDMSQTSNDRSASTDTSATSNNTNASSDTAQATTVTIQNFSYSPAKVTIKKGTKVTWTNKDSTRHDVSPDTDGAFPKSELLAQGESYGHTFDTVGTFSYHCSPHPYMKGTIEVTE